jgi:hypothetical protein
MNDKKCEEFIREREITINRIKDLENVKNFNKINTQKQM